MKKHVHILGICGTFMGGLARLARDMGYSVTGSDHNVYPPMSTQLEQAGIELMQGYKVEHLQKSKPELVIIGNALSRGNPVVEYILEHNIPYISGPQWLSECLLKDRWVLAVAGTHGKTTTTGMLAWILQAAGMKPGFLIGGVPANFGVSSALGDSSFFVIEADEYDTAFFDKRSKFLHYHPRTLILNNLEYDHADIFPDLESIKRQFQHLLRIVPGNGLVVVNGEDKNLAEVLTRGCWTPVQYYKLSEKAQAAWAALPLRADGSIFEVYSGGQKLGRVEWELMGEHNMENALAALAAAKHAGVMPDVAINALSQFKGVKRRLEVRGVIKGITVYDDFAHHPTAIEKTLSGLRKHIGAARLIAVLEPRSNTMRLGVHNNRLRESLAAADKVWIYQPEGMDLQLGSDSLASIRVCNSVEGMLQELTGQFKPDDHVVIMSNGDFGGLHNKLLSYLEQD